MNQEDYIEKYMALYGGKNSHLETYLKNSVNIFVN